GERGGGGGGGGGGGDGGGPRFVAKRGAVSTGGTPGSPRAPPPREEGGWGGKLGSPHVRNMGFPHGSEPEASDAHAHQSASSSPYTFAAWMSASVSMYSSATWHCSSRPGPQMRPGSRRSPYQARSVAAPKPRGTRSSPTASSARVVA